MTFDDYLEEIKKLLQKKYPEIDFDNDLPVNNKLNDLAFIITKRYNDPMPKKPKKKEPTVDKKDWRWRRKRGTQ